MKGKILFFEFFIIVVLITVLSSFGFTINFTKAKNDELYQVFYVGEYVDSDGEVNLVELQDKRDEALKNLHDISGLNDVEDVYAKMDDVRDANSHSSHDIDELANRINQLRDEVQNLEQQQQVLEKKYKEIQKRKEVVYNSSRINDSSLVLISNFPSFNQYPNYPTGCESVALTLLLNYYGVSVSVSDVIANLSKEDLPFSENGILYGGNPEKGFVGDPYSSNGYGVYESPIGNVSNMYKGGVISRSGVPFSEVLNFVSQNKPVVVWTSMGLSVPYISSSWIYKPTGEKISWKANEHAVVLIGYNDNYVIISDPMGGQIKYQSRSVFEQRYNYFGRKVVYYP